MRDKTGISGRVRAVVLGPDGLPRRRRLTVGLVLQIVFHAGFRLREMMEMFRYEISIQHNIVTNEGDALIADQLAETPARTKVDNSNGVIGVGDGYVSALKTTDALVNQIGSNQSMASGYPQLKGSFGAPDDNVLVYRASFAAGVSTGNGLDEALLGNGTDTLAYAQLNPAVNKGASDTLQIDWELTFLGS
jgi:hypothetical protein